MAAIYFQLNPKQTAEMESLMEEEGYTSKAEFFRFLMKFFKFRKMDSEAEIQRQIKKEVAEIEHILTKLNEAGKLDELIHPMDEPIDFSDV